MSQFCLFLNKEYLLTFCGNNKVKKCEYCSCNINFNEILVININFDKINASFGSSTEVKLFYMYSKLFLGASAIFRAFAHVCTSDKFLDEFQRQSYRSFNKSVLNIESENLLVIFIHFFPTYTRFL